MSILAKMGDWQVTRASFAVGFFVVVVVLGWCCYFGRGDRAGTGKDVGPCGRWLRGKERAKLWGAPTCVPQPNPNACYLLQGTATPWAPPSLSHGKKKAPRCSYLARSGPRGELKTGRVAWGVAAWPRPHGAVGTPPPHGGAATRGVTGAVLGNPTVSGMCGRDLGS